MTDTQLAERIEVARQFKRNVCGYQILLEQHLGDKPQRTIEQRQKRPSSLTPEVIRARQKNYNYVHQLARVTRTKKANGGISGVTKVPHTRKGVAKFRAWVGWGSRVYLCALDAAAYRNQEMSHSHPGEDAYQCDIEAVWDKWGCTCGNHKRGS